jgi:hypothetical protein
MTESNSSIKKYNKLNEKSFKGEVLLYCRKQHISEIAKRIMDRKLINYEFIDENIKLEYLNKKKEVIINDEVRLKYINKLLQTECSKYTAKLINQLVEK